MVENMRGKISEATWSGLSMSQGFYLNQQKQNKLGYEKGFSFSGGKVWMCADKEVLKETAHHGRA